MGGKAECKPGRVGGYSNKSRSTGCAERMPPAESTAARDGAAAVCHRPGKEVHTSLGSTEGPQVGSCLQSLDPGAPNFAVAWIWIQAGTL